MSKKRLNIGLLISELDDAFTGLVCEGAICAAKELDANIFIFPGKYLNPDFFDVERTQYEYQHNSVFDYARMSKMDVLLICSGTIATSVTVEEKVCFLDKFKSIPVILIADNVPGYPCVRFDNISGFKDGIRHLIEVHKCKRIGYVSGPETSEDARERLQAFKEVMAAAGLIVDPKQIVYGNFSEYSQKVVRTLMADNSDLDAVVFANDMMAYGGYKVFEELGVRVGEKLSVIGFDDIPHATVMEPALSTVRADALELGYRAVISFPDILAGRVDEVLVNSEFITRQSCGCKPSASTNLDIGKSDLTDGFDPATTLETIYQFLLKRNSTQSGSEQIKQKITEYIFYIRKHFFKREITDEEWHGLSISMKALCKIRLEPYTNIFKVFELFEHVYGIIRDDMNDEQKVRLTSLLFDMYKYFVLNTKKHYESKNDDAYWLNVISTTFTRDILNFAVDEDKAFYSITQKLNQLNFNRAYLCLLEEYTTRLRDEETKIPEYFLLKSRLVDGIVVYGEKKDRKIQTKNMLNELFADSRERVTAMVSVLYSSSEQYGLFISEVDEDHLNFVLPVTYQISAAVKTIGLLKSKEIITEKLEASLEQIKESNVILDELSKSDELTQIYNRRGFLTTARFQVQHPSNTGKKAAIIYADMNNLKIINDRFGHEEGDYSLKLIASILKEAFPDGIVGRFGGDEFVAFTLTDSARPTDEIRSRVAQIAKQKNEANDKPYYVSMSVGVCEFLCDEKIDIQDIIDKADVDLYIEKKHKRNNVMK